MGDMDQEKRDKLIDDFRKTTITTLICTNVLARGIDVPEVDLVINYDVPIIPHMGFQHPDFANYMHRVGRTGRFGTDGVAVSLVANMSNDDDILDEIARHYGIEINEMKNVETLMEVYNEMRKVDN